MINSRQLAAGVLLLSSMGAHADFNWEAALSGGHRSEANRARDEYRHPQETLSFFWHRPGHDCHGALARRGLVYRSAGAPDGWQRHADRGPFQSQWR